jgi:vacuolar protein sorting-associated protein 45
MRDTEALRLVLLYALKYETHSNNDIVGLISKLKERGLPEDKINLVHGILKYGGVRRRKSDLFGSGELSAVTKRFMKGLQGVENIYTQHTPWIKGVIEDALRGKLKDTAYPYFDAGKRVDLNYRPGELIVFMIGGITYEEALAVHNINRAEGRVAVVLGGTAMHNSTSFLEELKAVTAASSSSSAAGKRGERRNV